MIGNIGRWSIDDDGPSPQISSTAKLPMPVPSTPSSSRQKSVSDEPPSSSSSSPFKALRRIPSRLASAFSFNDKRKKRKASPSPPPKKRARIAAPDSFGSEESRQLIALLDSPSQPDYNNRKMLEDLERRRTVDREREELARAASVDGQLSDGSGDEEEIDCSLGLNSEHAGPSGSRLPPLRNGKAKAVEDASQVGESRKSNKGKGRANDSKIKQKPLSRRSKGKGRAVEESSPDKDAGSVELQASTSSSEANGGNSNLDSLGQANVTHTNGPLDAHPSSPFAPSEHADMSIDIHVQQPASSATFPIAEPGERIQPNDQSLSDQDEQLLVSGVHDGTTGGQRDTNSPEDVTQSAEANELQTQNQDTSEDLSATGGSPLQSVGDSQQDVSDNIEVAATIANGHPPEGLEGANHTNKEEHSEDAALSFDAPSSTKPSEAESTSDTGVTDVIVPALVEPALTNGGATTAAIAESVVQLVNGSAASSEVDDSDAPSTVLGGGLYPALPQPMIQMLPEPDESAASSAEQVEPAQPNEHEHDTPLVQPAVPQRPDSADALTEDVQPLEVDMLEGERAGVDSSEDALEDDEGKDVLPSGGRETAGLPNGDFQESTLPAIARHTNEVGEEEDVVEEQDLPDNTEATDNIEAIVEEGEDIIVQQPGSVVAAVPAVADSGPIEVIDFTAEDSDDGVEDIVIAGPGAKSDQPATSTPLIRKPSSGLLRGPLSEAASEQRPAASTASRIPIPSRHVGDASSLIRQMGRTSLASPSPARGTGTSLHGGDASSVSMGELFANQRYQRPQSKRRSILHNEHKAKIRAKNQRGMAALKMFFQQNATSLRRAGFEDPASLDSYLQYAEIIYQGGADTAPPKTRASAFEALANRDSVRQHQLRLLLGKSRATQSRIAIKPGKEQRRLRREQQIKERRRRGILGRPRLPLQLEPAQEEAVRTILNDRSWKTSIPGASATHHDIVKLRPQTWMNDETITFYLTMVNQRAQQAEQERLKPSYDKRKWDAFYRVHAFNSHFWARLESNGYSSVARWTRKINIFDKDLILIPCNLGNSHWTCAAINFRLKLFEYYDSMGHRNPRILSKLREYVKQEMADKKRDGVVDLNEFQDYYATDTSPQQRNSYDCGVFVCATLEQLSRRDPHYPFHEEPPPLDPLDDEEDGSTIVARDGYDWNFSQRDMPYMRKRIIFEISQKSLLD